MHAKCRNSFILIINKFKFTSLNTFKLTLSSKCSVQRCRTFCHAMSVMQFRQNNTYEVANFFSNQCVQRCHSCLYYISVLFGNYKTYNFDFEDSSYSNFTVSTCSSSNTECWLRGAGRQNTLSGPQEDHTFGAPQGNSVFIPRVRYTYLHNYIQMMYTSIAYHYKLFVVVRNTRVHHLKLKRLTLYVIRNQFKIEAVCFCYCSFFSRYM